MTDYTELVKALRLCQKDDGCESCAYKKDMLQQFCWLDAMADAAAAIEALQGDIKRLKEANDELREAQTYIDHYGDRWMTSAKDVPTAAYEHGYADGRAEAEAQLPKRGKWINSKERMRPDMCSVCGCIYEADRFMDKIAWNYCPNCGSLMVGENDERN